MLNTAACPSDRVGCYQQLGGASRAAVVDDLEADPVKRGCNDTFEIARTTVPFASRIAWLTSLRMALPVREED